MRDNRKAVPPSHVVLRQQCKAYVNVPYRQKYALSIRKVTIQLLLLL